MKKVSTLNMTRDEWLSVRNKSIGGSDAAAVVGLNDYKSQYYLFCEKTGKIIPDDLTDKESVRLGNDLENYVAQRWSEATGKKVRRDNNILYNEAYPFAHANIDRLVIGEKAGLECKTTSTLDVKQFNGVEFPVKYYAQCVHYLAVTGYERWYLAVLVFGRGFYTYVLERDQDEINALMQAEAEFWECVKNNTPPAIDGSDATTDAISTIWKYSDGGEIPLIGRVPMLDEYFSLREQKKAIDEQISAIENIIKEDMESAERANEGKYTVSWKSQTRSSFQPKEFAKAHPEIDLTPFYKTTTSRPFKVTMKEEKEA